MEKNFKVTIDVSEEMVRNLLCCALEGGSNYWCKIQNIVLPEGTVMADFQEGGRMQEPGKYWHPAEIIPFTLDGKLLIVDREGQDPKEYVLDRAAIASGLQLMSEKHPRHWGNFLSGNEDASTGDLFLQLCLFGEEVYC